MATNIVPSGLKTWHAFAFLIVTAVGLLLRRQADPLIAVVLIIRGG